MAPTRQAATQVFFNGTPLLLARKRQGLTQDEVARKFGVTTRQYQRWEASESAPSGKNLIKVARFFDVSTDELYGLKGAA